MNKKQIIFPIEIKAVNHPRSYILQKAFTSDLNSVELVFKLTDCTTADLTGATASILLFMRDGSFFQDVPTITGTDVKYTLTEAQGNHAGVAQAQLIVKSGTDEWASDKQKFEIIAGLETAVATEVMIKDWTMLTAEARAYLDTAEAAEAARVETFGQWSDTQANWAAAEAARVNDFSSKADKTYTDTELAKKVDKTTTVNGKALSANVSVTAADVPNTPAGGVAATNAQAAINELDTEKANKAQEGWKTPTLVNGATSYNGTDPYGYYKDEFGMVHLRGTIKTLGLGASFMMFTLPIGYRPEQDIFKSVTSNFAFGNVTIAKAGTISPSQGNQNWFCLTGICFKAGA